ncbi:MAG TPA: pyridoxamine 5'-phosphate oxidase family protein [Acidimicrobiia bacterium]|nr:pyridoxamine 5'-phosphate oxidase family protein [Acidimicrobiia bacterium]
MTAPVCLDDIRPCFEGAIPAAIATVDARGMPNITHLSQVFYIDAEHVALSNQFFSKTSQNLREHPYASVEVIHPETYACYRLQLRYLRTDVDGPVFEQLRRSIDAIAALTGMQHVFRLRGADVYSVQSCRRVATAMPD